MADIDSWVEAQEFQITLDAEGRIIDYMWLPNYKRYLFYKQSNYSSEPFKFYPIQSNYFIVGGSLEKRGKTEFSPESKKVLAARDSI